MAKLRDLPPPGALTHEYAIGIYVGNSPLELAPHPDVSNPVLTRKHVSDTAAGFVADPFIVREQDAWYMFFEVFNWKTRKGEIALATSRDGLRWTYRQVVLREPTHLAYPSVFAWKGEYYMIPDTYELKAVRLYKADRFPTQWTLASVLLEGESVDATTFYYDDTWWMFVCTNPYEHDTLCLYYAEEFQGPWHAHPQSPLIAGNDRTARPAGRVLITDDRLIRFAQDCQPRYGTCVRAFEITELTRGAYAESEVCESPVLGPSGAWWNAGGMHHVDLHPTGQGRWMAAVDGWIRHPG